MWKVKDNHDFLILSAFGYDRPYWRDPSIEQSDRKYTSAAWELLEGLTEMEYVTLV